MRALHVLDVFDSKKSIPRVALNTAKKFDGDSLITADYFAEKCPVNNANMKYCVKNQSEFDIIILHSAIHALSFKKSAKKIMHSYYGIPSNWFRMYFIKHYINEKFMAKKFKAVIACSEYLAADYNRMYGRLPDVVRLGVDIDTFSPMEKIENGSYPNYLFVGTLAEKKRVDLLVSSMKHVVEKYPNAKLVIAGSGPNLDVLEHLTDDLGLSKNVDFLGKISDDDLVKAYNNCDVYVTASRWEGFGMPLLEAMSCGKPVVASNSPAHVELIRESNAGVCVEQNSSSMANGMLSILEQAKELGVRARSFAERNSWENYVRRLSLLVK